MMSNINDNIPEKVLKYEEFVNDNLKEDLKKIDNELGLITSELSDYIQLHNTIRTFVDIELNKNGLKTQVDIGCNFYIQANIDNLSNILVNVGCGYFVDFTLDEALVIIEKRLLLLEKKCKILRKRSAMTKANIKLVLFGIQELQKVK